MKKTYETSRNTTYPSVLQKLRTIPAKEFFTAPEKPQASSQSPVPPSPAIPEGLESDQEYRFLKAVVEHPMQPSSSYSKLASIRTEAAAIIRERQIALGYLRTHAMDTSRRGRSTLMLEPLPAGVEAVGRYEASRRNK
jgi:hypothetical protein